MSADGPHAAGAAPVPGQNNDVAGLHDDDTASAAKSVTDDVTSDDDVPGHDEPQNRDATIQALREHHVAMGRLLAQLDGAVPGVGGDEAICVKDAARLARCSESTITRRIATEPALSFKRGGTRMVWKNVLLYGSPQNEHD